MLTSFRALVVLVCLLPLYSSASELLPLQPLIDETDDGET